MTSYGSYLFEVNWDSKVHLLDTFILIDNGTVTVRKLYTFILIVNRIQNTSFDTDEPFIVNGSFWLITIMDTSNNYDLQII